MSNLIQNGLSYEPDSLFVSNKVHVLTKGILIKQGTIAKRGGVIALDEASKKGTLADKTRETDRVEGILTDNVNAAEADVIATVYITGHFNAEALSFAEGTVLGDYEMELRKLGIYTGTVKEGN
jgi:hypothetical protein